MLVHGASPHYHLLKLARTRAGGGAAGADELDVASAAAYRLTEGEALRRITLLRERPPGARDLGARPPPPVRCANLYELDALSA